MRAAVVLLAALSVIRAALGISVVLSAFALTVGYSCAARFAAVFTCNRLRIVCCTALGIVRGNSSVLVVSRLCSLVVLRTSGVLAWNHILSGISGASIYLGYICRFACYAAGGWPSLWFAVWNIAFVIVV